MEEVSRLETPDTTLLQRIQEEQGYLVVGSTVFKKVWETIPHLRWTLDNQTHRLDERVTVVGETSYAEFESQAKKFGLDWVEEWAIYPYYYKVIAE